MEIHSQHIKYQKSKYKMQLKVSRPRPLGNELRTKVARYSHTLEESYKLSFKDDR